MEFDINALPGDPDANEERDIQTEAHARRSGRKKIEQ
jgi:hypothetical protein